MRTIRIKTAMRTSGLHGLCNTKQPCHKPTLRKKIVCYWQSHSTAFESKSILIFGTGLVLAAILFWINISAIERSKLHSDRLVAAIAYLDEIDRINKVIDSLDLTGHHSKTLGDNQDVERVNNLRRQLHSSNISLAEFGSRSNMHVVPHHLRNLTPANHRDNLLALSESVKHSVQQQIGQYNQQHKYRSWGSIFLLLTTVVFFAVLGFNLQRNPSANARFIHTRGSANELPIGDNTSPIEEAARASERAIIARDIHDELGALLMAVKIDMKRLSKNTANAVGGVDARWAVMLERIDTAMYTVTHIAENLKPPQVDHIGFWPIFENYIKDYEAALAIPCSLRFDMAEPPPVPQNSADDIFHILQETLTNVARHAKASKIEIEVRGMNGQLEICIADNGTGISPAHILQPHSAGIAGMFERAKRHGCDLTMCRQITGGTMVQIRMQLERSSNEQSST